METGGKLGGVRTEEVGMVIRQHIKGVWSLELQLLNYSLDYRYVL